MRLAGRATAEQKSQESSVKCSEWYGSRCVGAGRRAGAGEVLGGLARGRAAFAQHAGQSLVRQRGPAAQEQRHLLCHGPSGVVGMIFLTALLLALVSQAVHAISVPACLLQAQGAD